MGKGMKKEGEGEGPNKPIRPPRPVQGRALNRWDAEAERDLIMACLTSENNNYPTINWPRVKVIMDSLGYKFSRSALDQRWSKKIMREWRERHHGSTGTDFADPATANQTPGRKRGRVVAASRARADANALAATRQMDQANVDDYEEAEDDDDYELSEKKPAVKRARTALPQGNGGNVIVIGDDDAAAGEGVKPQPAHNSKANVGLMMSPTAFPGNPIIPKQAHSEDSKGSVGHGGLTPYNHVGPSPGRNGFAIPAYGSDSLGGYYGNVYTGNGYPMAGYNMQGHQNFNGQHPGAEYVAPANAYGFNPHPNLGAPANQNVTDTPLRGNRVQQGLKGNDIKDVKVDDDVIFDRERSVTMAPKPEGM